MACLAVSPLAACSGGGSDIAPVGADFLLPGEMSTAGLPDDLLIDGESASVRTRPRDIAGAVNFALPDSDLAFVEGFEDSANDRYVISAIDARDAPAWIEFTPVSGDDRSLRRVTVTAMIGRFGDEERERKLIKDISRHLATLRAGRTLVRRDP